MLKQRSVGILLFNEVEVLDFAGPFEVFSITNFPKSNLNSFRVNTVAQEKNTIKARNGLKIEPDYDFDNAPHFDILIIPGGYGAEEIEIHNPVVINWIKSRMESVQIIASVCTGAFLLAEAGILSGKQATTHWLDIDRLENEYKDVNVIRGVKFVDEYPVMTAGGISAGINMSFHIIKRLLGEESAKTTAKRMVYDLDINSI